MGQCDLVPQECQMDAMIMGAAQCAVGLSHKVVAIVFLNVH